MESLQKHKTNALVFLNLIATLLILLILAQIVSTQNTNYLNQMSGININQEEKKEVMPDKVTVVLSIINEGENPEELISQNSQINNRIIDYFKDQYQVETTRYTLTKKQEWDPETKNYVDKGFVVRNTISISTKDINKTGKIIQDAVSLGANAIENVYFEVSDGKLKEIQDQLLKQAIKDAKEKAELIAKEANVRLGKIVSITPSSYTPYPIPLRFSSEDLMKQGPSLEIEPEKQTVSYSVNILFEIR
ncbi:MAG: uncharacterized protein PWP03_219 [Candidatus Woesearchaeota archaeon]|nr:uncharacterized protein [Candidatus Woesearchaeota archaeon]